MMVYVDRFCLGGVLWVSREDHATHSTLLQDELWRDASPEGPSGASQCWLMWHPPGVVAACNVGEKTDAVNMNKVTKKVRERYVIVIAICCYIRRYSKGHVAAEDLLVRAIAILFHCIFTS